MRSRYLLLPFSPIYWLAITCRRWLYSLRLFKTHRLPGRVISVGNLTVGGTGKTPVTMMMAQHLVTAGHTTAILSRGYRSDYERKGVVFHGVHLSDVSETSLGDEIALLARKLPNCWFGVGKKRFENGLKLSRHGVEPFLLDDGFQHWQLHRDLDIVLVDATDPLSRNLLLPAGRLREPLRALRRANVVLVTRTESLNDNDISTLKRRLTNYCEEEQIFFLRTNLTAIVEFTSGRPVPLATLHNKRLCLFSAIGNPRSFEHLIESNGFQITDHIRYRDHHHYTETNVKYLLEMSEGGHCDLLITTEKDAVKLPRDLIPPQVCLVAEISFTLVEREDIFWSKVNEALFC